VFDTINRINEKRHLFSKLNSEENSEIVVHIVNVQNLEQKSVHHCYASHIQEFTIQSNCI